MSVAAGATDGPFGPGGDAQPAAWRLFANSSRDAWLVAGATLYAGALAAVLAAFGSAAAPAGGWGSRLGAILVLAIGVVWMSNTIAHVHLHTPLFRAAGANRGFSLFLTAVLGIPQTYWKRRHLQHHGLAPAGTAGLDEVVDVALLFGLWGTSTLVMPAAFLGTFVPAWLVGIALCAAQGHYEHVGGNAAGVDHHGGAYNRLWFNDGYHSLHHRAPAAHWTTLEPTGPAVAGAVAAARVSHWPPLLRWLEAAGVVRAGVVSVGSAIAPVVLDRLERAALASRFMRAFLLWTHEPALAALVRAMGAPRPRRICIVGGGLFPRTAILLARILPEAELVIVDADPAHLRAAERVLLHQPPIRGAGVVPRVTLVAGRCDGGPALPGEALATARFDLVVVPLALRGARERFYAARSGCHVLVHDWIWRRRGDESRVVSPLLLKRINLVRDPGRARRPQGWSNLDSLPQVVSATEARSEPSCRMTAPTTPTPPPVVPAPSTTRPSPAFAAAIGRRS